MCAFVRAASMHAFAVEEHNIADVRVRDRSVAAAQALGGCEVASYHYLCPVFTSDATWAIHTNTPLQRQLSISTARVVHTECSVQKLKH
jgi:hypothetical protein